MNQAVIFFVPTAATQHDFEAALRGHFALVQIDEDPPQAETAHAEITDNDHMPLWTWLIPNPCR